jgi:RNA recognition motif-containing protein
MDLGFLFTGDWFYNTYLFAKEPLSIEVRTRLPDEGKLIMSKKLFVGNLNYRVDEDTLKEVFAKIGEVESVKIIKDLTTGRSKGFGFVEMTSGGDAEKAIATLNGTDLMERPLTVNKARPQQTNRNRRGSRDRHNKSFRRGSGLGNWR